MSVIPYTRSNPCPICGEREGWCFASEDGRFACCRRVGGPGATERADKNGQRFFVHAVAAAIPSSDDSRAAARASEQETRREPVANVESCDAVYRSLLERLTLSTEHRAALHNRGLSDAHIDRAAYGSLPQDRRVREQLVRHVEATHRSTPLLSVPGFFRRGSTGIELAGSPGILIPIRDERGRIVACSIRVDNAGQGGKYRWLSAPKGTAGCSSGAHVHVPLRDTAKSELVRITEGPLKADIATRLSGTLTLGVPGVGNWKPALELLTRIGARRVLLAWDADVRRNENVARALADLAAAIQETGREIAIEQWDEVHGKGIDDVYAAGHADAIRICKGAEAWTAIESALASSGATSAHRPAALQSSLPLGARHVPCTEPMGNIETTGTASRSSENDAQGSIVDTRRDVPANVNTASRSGVGIATHHRDGSDDDETDGESKKGPSQSKRLLEIASRVRLFHSKDRRAYCVIPVGCHFETWSFDSRELERWLRTEFYRLEGVVAGEAAVQNALKLLEAQAIYSSPEEPIFLRVASADGRLYLDLADTDWHCVEISEDGWRLCDDPPVHFVRMSGLRPLPVPALGGSVDELRPFLNVETEDDWKLVVAWLLACFRPKGPFPILILQGEQGSAKSTTSRVLRDLIDPSVSSLRSLSATEENLMVAAANSWVLSFDNISGLTQERSDWLCRLSTGGGFGRRQLYSNSEEVLIDAQRPVILNGIDSLTSRADLTDRALVVTLPTLPAHRRRREDEFRRAFEEAWPRILGALLTALAGALRDLPSVVLPHLPRMADFAALATAAEGALGWTQGSFLSAYDRNRHDAVESSLEADAVATAVHGFVRRRGQWQGAASELLAELAKLFPTAAEGKGWPKTAHHLSSRLRRIGPLLRANGVEIETTRTGRCRQLRLWVAEEVASEASGVAGDAAAGACDAAVTLPASPANAGKDAVIGGGDADDASSRSPCADWQVRSTPAIASSHLNADSANRDPLSETPHRDLIAEAARVLDVERIEIRLPDGTSTTHRPARSQSELQPAHSERAISPPNKKEH